MAEDLQGLLEKIQTQGLDKANAERDAIIKKAQDSAAQIVAAAKADAAEIVRVAQNESASLTQRAESAVRQAARDIIFKLQAELKERLNNIIQDNTAKSMTPELIAEIIKEMTAGYSRNFGKPVTDLTLLVSAKQLDELETALKGALRSSFATQPKLFADMEISGGVEVAVNGNDVYFDFSDEAITEIISAYVGPRLAAILKGMAN